MTTEKQIKAKRGNRTKTSKSEAVIKKDNSKAIIKKQSSKETMDFINKIAYIDCDPDRIMKELSENLLPQIKAGKTNKKLITKASKSAYKALMIYGLDTHYPLAETVSEKYRPLVIEFSRQLIQEFDCRTSNEKALAQVIVNAYIRVIDNSRRFNNCLEAGEYLSDERTKYLSVISKQLDRANRQFITALSTLRQLKTPPLKVNVKTKTAFVAQNQQLNMNQPNKNNPNKNENIEPK